MQCEQCGAPQRVYGTKPDCVNCRRVKVGLYELSGKEVATAA